MKHSFFFLLSWLLPFFLFIFVDSRHYTIPRLGIVNRQETIMEHQPQNHQPVKVSPEFKKYYYNQTLDHFNYKPESYSLFSQKYYVNYKYWGGAAAAAPIFAYLGAEAPLDGDLGVIGFMTDNAPKFKALLVYIEHRYYGESIPFGSRKEAMRNTSTLGYFNSAQAIADYAEILLHVKKYLKAKNSPVIVIGGSYGGMLASWFRLKYPHIALGALASSSPILYFDNITPQDGYFSVVSNEFKEASESCYETIKHSWFEIINVASQPQGLSLLSKRFKLCSELNNSHELIDYLESKYAGAAQYNQPPDYPVKQICNAIDRAPEGSDPLGRVYAGLFVKKDSHQTCNNLTSPSSETSEGWAWQTCSEMVMPIGVSSTMFPLAAAFNLSSFIGDCMKNYGVAPRPHWITSYYGGHDIKLILHKFGSNIIFSNGLRDPYSSAGVLENISDSLLAVYTVKGSHCLDILPARSTDPSWLVKQREIEIAIIQEWIAKYYQEIWLFRM